MTQRAKSISDFCKELGISVATFYRRLDQMPKAVRIGGVRRILPEDEDAWRQDLRESPRTQLTDH